jgi:hypothetical protein
MAALPVRWPEPGARRAAATTLSRFRNYKPVILVGGDAALAAACVASVQASPLGSLDAAASPAIIVPVCLEVRRRLSSHRNNK